MKTKTLLLFLLVFLPLFTIAQIEKNYEKQKLAKISFGLIAEGKGLARNGFKGINNIFQQNNIMSLKNEIGATGLIVKFHGIKMKSGFEINLLRLNSIRNEKSGGTDLLPLIKGNTVRLLYFRRLFKKRKWYGLYELGLSFTRLDLQLIQGKAQTNQFPSLVSNPLLSSSVNLSQSVSDIGIDGSIGIYYKLNWLKKICNDLDTGFRIGYYQPFKRGRGWVESGTANNFVAGDLPRIQLDNFYAQFSIIISYNFMKMIGDYEK